jgi:hypothetical protein
MLAKFNTFRAWNSRGVLLPGTFGAHPMRLRVYNPDDKSQPVIQPKADALDDSALDTIAKKLHLLMSGSGADARTVSPGVSYQQPIVLKQVFESAYGRNRNDCTDSSWSGYRTLLQKWTTFWCGRGPDLRVLTSEHIQDFFEGVEEWRTERSWVKNCDLFFALLKSACPLTVDNKRGMKQDAWLSIDKLPVWDPPRDRWFRDRKKSAIEDTGRGGHKRCNLPLLTVSEFGQILTACESATYLNPLWWKCWFSQLWYHGPRWADFWRYTWNSHISQGCLRLDLKSSTIHVTETKAGGNGTCPMPSWLLSQFRQLKSAQSAADGDLVYISRPGEPVSQFRMSTGDAQNRERHWLPEFTAIWDRAGIPMRKPHQLRGVAISNWLKHAPIYRFSAIGHAPPKTDTQLRNYATFDEDFQRAAESYPFPDNHKH